MATFWRYVRIQLFVFLCGIVGPIFLILYFAVEPNADMKWAYWAGLFITAADVLIALAITSAGGVNKAPADVRLAAGPRQAQATRRRPRILVEQLRPVLAEQPRIHLDRLRVVIERLRLFVE